MKPSVHPRVVAIVLNWNGWQDTLRCVDTLQAATYPLRIVVVDNGSTDDSATHIHAAQPHIPLLAQPRNLGFGGGVNVGAAWAVAQGCDYLLLVNNDATVHPEAVTRLVAAAEHDPGLALLTPVILLEGSTKLWTLGADWQYFAIRQRSELPPTPLPAVLGMDIVYGCVMLVRTSAWQQLGGFDPAFFAYYEDADLALRSRDQGWRVGVVTAARAWHRVSSSTAQQPRMKVFHEMRGRMLFFRKRLRSADYLVFSLHELRYLMVRLLRYLRRGDWAAAGALLHGAWSGIIAKA